MLDDIDIPDVKTLNLATVYEFSQKHKREVAKSMKLIIQKLIKEAIKSNLYNLDKKSLDMFGDAYKVLDLGSPTQFVLHTVLLKLLARKKR
jgi:DNA polymerase-3 subunit delta'